MNPSPLATRRRQHRAGCGCATNLVIVHFKPCMTGIYIHFRCAHHADVQRTRDATVHRRVEEQLRDSKRNLEWRAFVRDGADGTDTLELAGNPLDELRLVQRARTCVSNARAIHPPGTDTTQLPRDGGATIARTVNVPSRSAWLSIFTASASLTRGVPPPVVYERSCSPFRSSLVEHGDIRQDGEHSEWANICT